MLGLKFFFFFFTITLVRSSVALAIVYKYRMNNKAKLSIGNKVADLQKVKTLFWLTFIQSTLNVITAGSDFTYNFISWLYHIFDLGDFEWLNQILPQFVDGSRAIADMLNFYILFALMPSFRQMVIKAVKQILANWSFV